MRAAWTCSHSASGGTRCHLLPRVLQLGVGPVALVLEGLEARLLSRHRVWGGAGGRTGREAPPLALGRGSSVLPLARAASALAACTARGGWQSPEVALLAPCSWVASCPLPGQALLLLPPQEQTEGSLHAGGYPAQSPGLRHPAPAHLQHMSRSCCKAGRPLFAIHCQCQHKAAETGR